MTVQLLEWIHFKLVFIVSFFSSKVNKEHIEEMGIQLMPISIFIGKPCFRCKHKACGEFIVMIVHFHGVESLSAWRKYILNFKCFVYSRFEKQVNRLLQITSIILTIFAIFFFFFGCLATAICNVFSEIVSDKKKNFSFVYLDFTKGQNFI